MKAVHLVAWVLVIIGALNWGLVGLGGFAGGNWNVVAIILGSWPMLEWAVYVLVGLSGLLLLAKKFMKESAVPSMGGSMGASSSSPM